MPMRAELGNSHALAPYRDAESDQPEVLRFRRLKGERVTEFVFPEGWDVEECVKAVENGMSHHIEDGKQPDWITASDPGLQARLLETYGLGDDHGHRPGQWGQGVED